ncbi:microcystin-dependent protein [Ancylobacter aquaticus]|uniref:Microcystin-dependent protein n=1 Tax=Ancylobacter aquaticus TaxID=100 RepID=A0A4R1I2B7_ANCAQ|nr:tail fiber protein [Ancylobacter aquaticus]TCK28073.1 microcystin-dependent protein [Ancylobacter aquaticus]
MVDCYVGEIRNFAGQRIPSGWALCDGRLLNINEYQALYSLLEFTWGGDGRTTFGIPDLRGKLAVGSGQGPGLSPRRTADASGFDKVELTSEHLPAHNHRLMASSSDAQSSSPTDRILSAAHSAASTDKPALFYIVNTANLNKRDLHPKSIGENSLAQTPHSNLMPSLSINYIIALTGLYPSEA